MKKFFVSVSFSFVIVAANLVALDVVQAKEPAKATDRLTAPHDNIEPTAPGSHTYQLAMSKDDKLCRHMLKLFNDDLAKYGYEQYGGHEEFRKIPWKDIRLSSLIPAKGALFDFNNDGVKEFVVRWESAGTRDVLSMLESEAARRTDKLTHEEAFESKNFIATEGWLYFVAVDLGTNRELGAIKNLETSWEDFVVLRPFLFNGKAHLYMRPNFESSVSTSGAKPAHSTDGPKPLYSVVARYLGGRISIANSHDGKIDDLCYFKRTRTDKRLPN